jgi:4-carboxymuconolactone decarboxylase
MPAAEFARDPLTIAEVAAVSGLSAQTLRYYERIGLLDPAARVHGGQRRYSAIDLAWLAFLQRLRATGMPIRDMQRFAKLRRQGDETSRRAERYLKRIAMRCSSESPNCSATWRRSPTRSRTTSSWRLRLMSTDILSPDRYARGRAKLAEVDGSAGEAVVDSLGDLGRHIVEYAFGDVYARPGLSLCDRELATVAMLAAMGGCEPQLDVHLHAARNVGLSVDELREVVIQVAPYAGFPAAINAMRRLQSLEADEATVTVE